MLQETEKHLSEMLQAIRLSESLTPKEEITFDSIKNWKDNDLQKLLCYVSKKDLVKALQSASLPVQQALARNIPPTLWQSLVQQTQMIICSKKESFEAQNKIMRLAELLKENR